MLQATDQRLLRAAGRFQWSHERLRIAEEVILKQNKLKDVVASLGLNYDAAKDMLKEARKQLRKQAQDECEPEAYGPEARLEEDPDGLRQHAIALQIAMDGEPDLETCEEAVLCVGAF
jgi:hypothetical protein